VVCAVPYAFPWDQLIGAFKYREQLDLAGPLSEVLAASVRDAHVQRASVGLAIDRVIPVPMAGERLAERGFNQAWELARRVAQHLECRAHPGLLVRTVAAAPQASLPRQARLSQLQGVFGLARGAQSALKGQRLALVDDVLTTGATARAATQVLKQAGAASVEVWTLARTDERPWSHTRP